MLAAGCIATAFTLTQVQEDARRAPHCFDREALHGLKLML